MCDSIMAMVGRVVINARWLMDKPPYHVALDLTLNSYHVALDLTLNS